MSDYKQDVILPWVEHQDLMFYFHTVGDEKAEAMLRTLKPALSKEWFFVKDSLPPEAEMGEIPYGSQWIIYTGIHVKTTTLHPAVWNKDNDFDGRPIQPVVAWIPCPKPPVEEYLANLSTELSQ
jgi:hypothetical protein